jgi:hydrophobic/amphiphilic exporter-1 (mainly G- bacteria), HAE1 family
MSPLIRLSLRLGSVVILAVILLFSVGIWAATQLQQDLLPNISVPSFVVITADPGASPGVVDQQVTLPVVNALQGVAGVTSVDSTSSSGASIVTVQFKDGTDLTAARQAMSTSLDRARAALPAQVQPPTIEAFSTSSVPVLQYAAYANESLGDLATQLRSVALPKLAGLSGVSTVNLTGAPTQEVDVTLDPAKLAAHGLGVGQVSAALAQAATVQSVGALKDNGAVIPLQIAGALISLDQIANVGVGPAAAIHDLGTVALVAVPADTITRTNGNPSVGLSVIKAPDANTVTVANEIKAALPDVRNAIGHGVQFQSILDQATPITDAIGSIVREGLLGALFAILVIFLFLRSARATLVAAVSIPLSLMVALIVLWWQGITLNILTLGGLMVAIGRVVDDAIVVLENISRHVTEGEGPLAAAYTGGREIVTAVTSSTLTTVGVFLPIAFLTGIAGSFFRPFALTVVTALLASLLVAVTVVPLLASRFLKPQLRAVGAQQPRSWLQAGYVPIIRWATGHRAITLVAAGAIFLGSLGLVPFLRINLLDPSSSPNFPVSLTMPDNSTLAQTNAETETVENLVRGLPGVSAFQATVGGSSDPFAPPGSVAADPATSQITVLVNSNAYNQALSNVTAALKNYHGPARVAVGQAQSSANASSSQMQVQVHAPNQGTLQQSTDRLMSALANVSGLSELKSNLTASKPQYQLVPTDRLGQTGLSVQQLAGLVAQQINGQVAAQALLTSGPISVRVQLPPGTADTPATLLSLRIPTAAGPLPLSTLATLQQVSGPQTINRSNGDRAATITGTITSNNTQAVQTRVDAAIKSVSLPAGTSVSTGGVFAQLSSVLTQFIIAILAAIGLVYLIMVATFRSLIKPLVLLVAIPFAATGAIVALVVTGTALSLPAMIGLLMLIGIVVTNAIVLIDLVEQYRERGLPLQQALIEGSRHRLRPILMTATATMLALAPLAFSGNSGGGFIGAPLAIVVIGGLFTSTLLTLILVPVLYSEASRFTNARTNRELDTMLDDAQAQRVAAGGGH